MSIRLKKVQWQDHPNFSSTYIMGDHYKIRIIAGHGWCANHRVNNPFATLSEAKAACEQHALERIREAVEVVSDHIPDATKMIEPNSPEFPDSWQPIETAPELEQVLIAYRGVNQNKPLIDVAFYHPDARSWDVCGHVRVNPVRVFAWMPLPEQPKEGAK